MADHMAITADGFVAAFATGPEFAKEGLVGFDLDMIAFVTKPDIMINAF